jgi:hypothetical protein
MASILFRRGLALAIGILGEGELAGEGVCEGTTGNESRSGMGNKRGFKEKANGLKSSDAPLCVRSGNSKTRRSGKDRSGEIFCGPGSMPKYSFRGEGSDKVFSLQSQTRRGKLSRNTPEIQEMGNLRKRSVKKMRRRKWSSYRRRWRIT